MKDYDELIEDTEYLLTTKAKDESAQKRHDQLSSARKSVMKFWKLCEGLDRRTKNLDAASAKSITPKRLFVSR